MRGDATPNECNGCVCLRRMLEVHCKRRGRVATLPFVYFTSTTLIYDHIYLARFISRNGDQAAEWSLARVEVKLATQRASYIRPGHLNTRTYNTVSLSMRFPSHFLSSRAPCPALLSYVSICYRMDRAYHDFAGSALWCDSRHIRFTKSRAMW